MVVSTDPNFQFNVTGNRELVGHFALGNRIDASVYLDIGGAVTGGGVWAAGETVTVEAIANPGYVFLNWTETTNVVSTSASYSFTSDANRTLMANFIAQPAVKTVLSPGSVTVSWPEGASGWVLQECGDLGMGAWTNSTRQVTVTGSQKQVTISPVTGMSFFRLVLP
jgi:hypothetical protein